MYNSTKQFRCDNNLCRTIKKVNSRYLLLRVPVDLWTHTRYHSIIDFSFSFLCAQISVRPQILHDARENMDASMHIFRLIFDARLEVHLCDNLPRKIPYCRLRPIHFGH
jgi:hypothetical protein